jgi:hypothetical protein
MYWSRSTYKINSLKDLELLQRIFCNVQGEIFEYDDSSNFNGENRIGNELVKWCKDPFAKLSIHNDTPFCVYARLVGPQTIFAVALKLKKIDPDSYNGENKDRLIEWAKLIDAKISNEMNRENDIGYGYKKPNSDLLNMEEIFLAAILSKHCTHILPGTSNCAIVINPNCVYAPTISIDDKSGFECFALFDKDDGFVPRCEEFNYINTKFNMWKDNDYAGNLAHYCSEYADYLDFK